MQRSTGSYFDQMAAGWGARYRGASTFSRRMSLVLNEIPPADEGARAVDVGCGTGELARALAERGYRTVGMDASAQMLASAPGLDRVRASALQLPFRSRSCSVVTAIGVLEYLPDPSSAFAELARLVAPGGRALITLPNPRSLLRLAERLAYRVTAVTGRPGRLGYLRYLDHSRPISFGELRAAGQRAGLRERARRHFTPALAEGVGAPLLTMNVLLRYEAV